MSGSALLSPTGTSPAGLRASAPLVVAGFVISFVVIGGGIDTVGVFINAMSRATDWSRSSLSFAVSVGAVSAALSTPLVGVAIDRFGVRVPMIAGVALLAVGFSVLIRMQEAWHFAAANVALGAGFAACALLPITVAVTVNIPDRTALALGIVGSGSSVGALVLAPALQAAVDSLGWRDTYMLLGAMVILIPVPFLLFALPRGRLRRDQEAGGPPLFAPSSQASLVKEFRRPGALPVAALMILPGLTSFSITVHLVPYLTDVGHSATTAAAALGTTIGISAIGKVAGGFVADRFGSLHTIRLALVLWAVALLLLLRVETLPPLGVFILLYGLAVGTQIAVIPAIAIAVLGSERFGTLFGVLQLAAMLGSGVGPVVSGVMFDHSGHYAGAILFWFIVMAGATAIAFRMTAADVTATPSAAREGRAIV